VSIVQGSAARALAASETLRRAGFLVAAIRPPTVPPGTSRLRVTFSAAHTSAQVAALAATVRPLLAAE
jgi:8-amino-7-oxononanoate synthase